MNPVLQQWLLNLAIDFPVPLRLLAPVLNGRDSEATALNVKSLRGFTLEDGMSRLVELAETGFVEFTHTTEQGNSRMIAPTEILPLMSRPGIESELSFKLTHAGGGTWESVAEPRWHEMDDGFATLRYENDEIAGYDWTLFSQNRDRLMAVIGWWLMFNSDQINLDSIAWTLTKDHEVKYWKHLPNVHVVTFHSWATGPSMPAWRRGMTPEWFTSWKTAKSSWYRHPWEMEGWPPQNPA